MVGNGSSRVGKIRGYATEAAFPPTGQKGVWYFDLSTGTPYIWNGTAYDDIDPTVDEIWQRVATVISQVNVGDDIAFYDGSSDTVFYMDVSAEELQVGKTTTAGVVEVKDASNVTQAKLNAVGGGYHVNDFGFGDKVPTAKVDIKGDFVLRPSSIQVMVAATGITGAMILANPTVKVVGNTGDITITATPSIGAGVHGQRLKIMGTDDTDTVTLQDETNLAGSDLNLAGGVDFTLGKGDSIVIEYDSTDSKWYEESRCNVTYTA